MGGSKLSNFSFSSNDLFSKNDKFPKNDKYFPVVMYGCES